MVALNSRKGISPLIASVLLIAFTMSVAMLAGPFFSNTLKSIQSGTLEDVNKVQTAAGLRLDLVQVGYNRSTGNLSVTVRNDGEERMDGNLSVGILGSGPRQQVFDINLTQSEITTLEMPVKRVYYLDSIEVALTEYPVSNRRNTECLLNYRPVGYWSFDNDDTKDDWLLDLSSYSNNGSIPSEVETSADGKVGGSFRFDTRGDPVKVQTSEGLETSELTYSVFLYRTSDDSKQVFLEKQDGFSDGYGSKYHFGDVQSRVFRDGDESRPQSQESWNKGEWLHLSAVIEGNFTTYFYNGEKVNNVTMSNELGISDSADLRIGGGFGGRIDELSYYNRSLSSSEVKALSKVHTKQQDFRCELKTN